MTAPIKTARSGIFTMVQRRISRCRLTFSLLLNLTAVCNPEDKSVLWGFISKYAPEATPEKHAVTRPTGGICYKILPR